MPTETTNSSNTSNTTTTTSNQALSPENQALIDAINQEDSIKIEEALTQKKADVNCMTSEGPPLVHAIKKCNLDIVKLLVGKGADINLTWVGKHLVNIVNNEPPIMIMTVIEYAAQCYDKVSMEKEKFSMEEEKQKKEKQKKISKILAYFFEYRPLITEKPIETMLNFYLTYVTEKKLANQLLEDYVLSHLTYCDLANLVLYTDITLKEKNTLDKALTNLDVTQNGENLSVGAPHCLLYYARIAGIFKVLLKKTTSLENSSQKYQEIIGEIDVLKKALAAEIEGVRLLRDLEAIPDCNQRQPLSAAIAKGIIKRVKQLKIKQEYTISTGWDKHAVCLTLMREQDNIIFRVDNLNDAEIAYHCSKPEKINSGLHERAYNLIRPRAIKSVPFNEIENQLDSQQDYLAQVVEKSIAVENNTRDQGLDFLYQNQRFSDSKITYIETELFFPSPEAQAKGNCFVKSHEPSLYFRIPTKELREEVEKHQHTWVLGIQNRSLDLMEYWNKQLSKKYLQNTPEEKLLTFLKLKYQKNLFIERVIGEKTLISLEDSYINLSLIEGNSQKEKEQLEKKEQKSSDVMFRDERLNSFENLYTPQKIISLEKLFDKEENETKDPRRLLILGRAGIGKTTLCKYIALEWANEKQWKGRFKAVFWVPLRELLSCTKQALTSADVIYACCLKEGKKIEQKELEKILEHYGDKCLWILDGYDEVASHIEKNPNPWKTLFKSIWEKGTVIVTSRPHGISSNLIIGDATFQFERTLENMGFTNANIEAYVKKFVSPSSQGETLIKILKGNSALWGIAHIPINLDLLCSIKQSKKMKSMTLTTIYEKLIETLFKRYKKNTATETNEIFNMKSNIKTLKIALANLAYYAMTHETLLISEKDYKENLKAFTKVFPFIGKELLKTGIIKQTGDGMIYFIHLTFQEFFAARHLQMLFHETTPSPSDKRWKNFQQYKYDEYCEIMWGFTAGLLYQHYKKNKFNINARQPLKNFWHAFLEEPRDVIGLRETVVMIRCLEECKADEGFSIHRKLLRHVARWFGYLVENEVVIKKRRIMKTENQSFSYFMHYLSTSPNVHCSQALSVVYDGENKKENILEIIRKLHNKNKNGNVLEMIRNLLESDFYTDIYYIGYGCSLMLKNDKKTPAENEILIYKDEKNHLFCWIKSKKPLEVPESNALFSMLNEKIKKESKNFSDEEQNKVLQFTSNCDDTLLSRLMLRYQYIEYCKFLGITSFFLETLKCDAVIALGELAQTGIKLSEKNLNVVIKLLEDSHSGVRGAAARALGDFAKAGMELPKGSLKAVIKLLEDGPSDVRGAAARALGDFANAGMELPKESFNAVIKLLEDSDSDVRRDAVSALVKLAKAGIKLPEESLNAVMKLLEGSNELVRSDAVRALGDFAKAGMELPEESLNAVIKLLEDSNGLIRGDAVRALGKLAQAGVKLPKESLNAVIKLLEHSDFDVRREAVSALGNFAQAEMKLPKEGLNAVLKLLEDSVSYVRSAAVEVLVELAKAGGNLSKEILNAVIKLLEHSDYSIQYDAVSALVKLAKAGIKLPEESLNAVMKLLEGSNEQSWIGAVEALVELAKAGGNLSKEILNVVIKLLEHSVSPFRFTAVSALGKLAQAGVKLPKESLNAVIKLLEDSDSCVRSDAARALGELAQAGITPPKESLNAVIKLLEGSNYGVMCDAAMALVELAQAGITLPKESLKAVIKLLLKFQDHWRVAALVELAKVGGNLSKEILNVVIKLLKDSEYNVRYDVVRGLGALAKAGVKFPDLEVNISKLIDLSTDDCGDSDVRKLAVSILHQLFSECVSKNSSLLTTPLLKSIAQFSLYNPLLLSFNSTTKKLCFKLDRKCYEISVSLFEWENTQKKILEIFYQQAKVNKLPLGHYYKTQLKIGDNKIGNKKQKKSSHSPQQNSNILSNNSFFNQSSPILNNNQPSLMILNNQPPNG